MRRRSLALALVLCACKVPPADGTRPGEAEAADRADPALAEVARRIDPGPQRALIEDLPTWLKEKVDAALPADGGGTDPVAAAREAIAAWDKLPPGDIQAILAGALQLGRGLTLAERAVLAGSSDPELLAALSKAYRIVGQLGMFQKNGIFGQMMSLGVEIARKEGKLDTPQIEEAIGLLQAAIARAPALQMHVAARLLREHPRHPTVPDVLLRIAQTRLDAEEYAEAVELRRLAVEREGARATGPDHAGLAETCYRALDIACGDMYRKTAEKLGPEEPGDAKKVEAWGKRLKVIDETAGRAREVLALAQQGGLAAGLQRGHLLLKMQRNRDAEETFTKLRAEHPREARPVTGLALLALHRGGDFLGAARLAREARGLEGRDRQYYEVALGTIPLVALAELMPELAADKTPAGALHVLAELQDLVVGYRAFDPARAAVLDLVLEMTREALPGIVAKDRARGLALLRGASARALALTTKFPESKDAWKLVYMTVRLAPGVKEAEAIVRSPLPPALEKDPDVRLQQVRALIDLGILWEHAPLLEEALRAAASLPEGIDADTARTIRATLDAIRGRTGDKEALQRAIAAFGDLAARKTGKEQALALNNLALLQAVAGDTASVATLEQARAADTEVFASLLNFGALAYTLEQREGLAELFGAVAGKASSSAVRLQAYAWLVALADAGFGDVAVTRREFAAALAKDREEEFRGNLSTGRWGVAVTGSFKVSLGFTTGDGLVLLDEVESQWWLIAPAPTTDALLQPPAPAPVKGKQRAAK